MAYNSRPGKVDHLLIIRGLASLGVLLSHALVLSSNNISLLSFLQRPQFDTNILVQFLIKIFPDTGENFVICFFVLSGYLMGKLFLSKGSKIDKKTLLNFYRRRILRIAPLLYFNLIICIAIFSYSVPYPLQTLGDFLFINNVTGKSINAVTWSISYEMQYYLVAPFIYMLFSEPSRKTFIKVLAVCIITSAAAFFKTILVLKLVSFIYIFLVGYLVNISIRLCHPKKPKHGNAVGLTLFILGNGLYYAIYHSGNIFLANSILALLMGLSIYVIELPKDEENVRSRAMEAFLSFWTWLGIISYGVYLWHYPILLCQHDKVIKIIDQLRDKGILTTDLQYVLTGQFVQLGLTLILTLILSLVTFFIVELRFRPNLYNFESLPFRKSKVYLFFFGS